MKTAVVLAALLSVSVAFQFTEEWEMWKKDFGKSYNSAEEELNKRITWESNQLFVENHNANNKGFSVKMNEFGDMESGEFNRIYNGLLDVTVLKRDSINVRKFNASAPLDATVDWRTKNAVTPIKNQGKCGSCWSFSATGSLEGQYFLKTKTLKSFSEQQLVDCSTSYGNHGCKGGLMDFAFKYLEHDKDELETDYPYTAEDGACRYNAGEAVAGDGSYVDVQRDSEAALKEAVANVGPISIAMDASRTSFHMYHEGVYYDAECSSTKLDHGVLIVGYGTQDGEDYWLVKNSWGTTWGMEGYFMIARNKGNACGIATQASYPTSITV